jgi:glycosyltransferase involved in cell wall biosynthesis
VKLSFVIPTRNQGRFIRRCIDRCLEQGIASSEVIVVDGLSTDGTQEILRSYGDRIAWTSEADSGQAEAVNKGVARARGEIVAWVNSDDYYPGPTTLRTVLAAFDGDPGVDVVYGGALVVDAEGRPIRPHRTRELRALSDVLVTPTGPSMQPAIFFRRSLFLAAGGLRPDLHYAMDYDLWLRMFPLARALRFLPEPLACATFHAGAKSIAGMWRQVRELGRLKRLHRASFALSLPDRLRLRLGVASLYAYWAAVRLGLRRAA